MRLFQRLLTLALVAMFAMPLGMTFAQDESSPEAAEGNGTAFASGIGVPTTLFDERGNPVMTMAVTNVELDWAEYEDMFAPEAGKMYVVLTIEYTNLTNRPMQISPFSIQVLDGYGMVAQPGMFFGGDDFDTEDISIDAGATGETSTNYIMWADTAPMLVIYQPGFEQWAVVHLPN